MRRRATLLLAGSVLAFLATLVVTIGMLSRPTASQQVRLPTGEVLQLAKVTYGTNHQWSPEGWWQQFLARVKPSASSQGPYVSYLYSEGTPPPYLIFWFTGPSAPPKGLPPPYHVLAADETGHEYALGDNLYHLRAGEPRVEYFRVPVPAQGRTVTLRFYDRREARFASITVANPAANSASVHLRPPFSPAPSPVMVPPAPVTRGIPCPQTRQTGDATLLLSEVTAGLSSGGHGRSRPEVLLQKPSVAAHPGELPWTRVAFRLRGTEGWLPRIVTLRDANGNLYLQNYLRIRNGTNWAAIPGFVAPEGPVSLRVELQRRGGYADRPEERWVVRNVLSPGEGQVTPLNQKRTLKGVRMELRALAGRGTSAGPGRIDRMKMPYLRVFVDHLDSDCLLAVWAVDEQGRRYDSIPPIHGGYRKPLEYGIQLPIPRTVKRVALHLAIHRSVPTQAIDFVVQPQRVSTQAVP